MNPIEIYHKVKEYLEKNSAKPMTEAEMKKVLFIESILGFPGRLISGQKNNYNGKCVFNSNLCTKSRKLWFGDIDFARDEKKLQEIADKLNETIYILKEMDGRFENGKKPKIEKAVFVVNPSSK